MTGTVKSYGMKNGYGFIENEEGEIFFFHHSEWNLPCRPQKGLIVDYECIDTEKGRRAVNVRMARRK